MNYKEVLTNLYFDLICADGHINEKEVSMGRKMVEFEGIDEQYFFSKIKLLEIDKQSNHLTEAIEALRKLTREEQIKCIAWLCVVANSDGFMDKTEWQMIYKIYHKELQLPLEDIMKMQKELAKKTFRNSPSSNTPTVLLA